VRGQPRAKEFTPAAWRRVAMKDLRFESLDFEVVEVERKGHPGCSGSSSTNPRCTCPVISVNDSE